MMATIPESELELQEYVLRQIDDAAIDRILSASPKVPPAKDKADLLQELNKAFIYVDGLREPVRKGRAKRKAVSAKIAKLSGKLQHELQQLTDVLMDPSANGNDIITYKAFWRDFGDQLGIDNARERFQAELNLSKYLSALKNIAEANWDLPGSLAGSAQLIWDARVLPDIYENFFEADAGRSRTPEQKLTGPYVKFAQAVAREFGFSDNAETIARNYYWRSRDIG